MSYNSKFEYLVLPGTVTPQFYRYATYLNVYNFWKKTWIDEMTKAGGDPGVVMADDFLRQSEISVVLSGEEVVAMLMSTLYDLSCAPHRDVKYFSKFPELTLKKLAEKGPLVQTMEFLTVNPEWRAARAGVSMGPVLIGLVIKRATRAKASASVGVARVDNRVDEAMMRFGGTPLCKVTKANIECNIVSIYQHLLKPNPKPEVEEKIAELWQAQKDYCEEVRAAERRVA